MPAKIENIDSYQCLYRRKVESVENINFRHFSALVT